MGSLAASLINAANALQCISRRIGSDGEQRHQREYSGICQSIWSTLVAQPFDLATGDSGRREAWGLRKIRATNTPNSPCAPSRPLIHTINSKSPISAPRKTISVSPPLRASRPDFSALFGSFSSLSVTPNDTVARQTVLNDATTVAQDFNDAADGLLSQTNNLQQGTSGTITASTSWPARSRKSTRKHSVDPSGEVDAGVDAQLTCIARSVVAIRQFHRAATAGRTNIGLLWAAKRRWWWASNRTRFKAISRRPRLPSSAARAPTLPTSSADGQLGAELNDNNNLLPSYVSGLNTLAQTLADQVNNALNNGIDENGAAPVTNLFTYNATTGAAASLAVNPLTPDQIAAASPGAPGGNGNALALAALANAPVVKRLHFRASLRQSGRASGQRPFIGNQQQHHRSKLC